MISGNGDCEQDSSSKENTRRKWEGEELQTRPGKQSEASAKQYPSLKDGERIKSLGSLAFLFLPAIYECI